MVQLVQSTRPLNPLLINALRHAPHPVHAAVLGTMYADPKHFESDVRVLKMKGMVCETDAGLAWMGS